MTSIHLLEKREDFQIITTLAHEFRYVIGIRCASVFNRDGILEEKTLSWGSHYHEADIIVGGGRDSEIQAVAVTW